MRSSTFGVEIPISLYGNVALQKERCPACGELRFVINGVTQCCFAEVELGEKRYKRESEPKQARKLPPRAERQRQLKKQGQRCFYCGRAFGSALMIRGKLRLLRVEWDHQVPFIYDQDNRTDNFVAACNICNRIKHDHYFKTEDEAKLFILDRWKRRFGEGV